MTVLAQGPAASGQAAFRHEAVPYEGSPAFATSCAEVVRDGLEHDERMLVLASQDKIDEVADLLGSDADDLTLVATDQHGRNPCRITTMLHSFQVSGDGRHATGIKETGFLGRSAAAQAETAFADFVLNAPGLQALDLSVLCLYDTDVLDDDQRLIMQQSHSAIRGTDENPFYAPDRVSELFSTLLAAAPPTAHRIATTPGRLARTRAFLAAVAADLGLAGGRVDDLVLAANEVVTNSIRYGGGRADVAIWAEDDTVACEVRDRGHISDPLAGRFAPEPAATGGRGLWLVNQVCDLVQIRSSQRGTVVRMFVDR